MPASRGCTARCLRRRLADRRGLFGPRRISVRRRPHDPVAQDGPAAATSLRGAWLTHPSAASRSRIGVSWRTSVVVTFGPTSTIRCIQDGQYYWAASIACAREGRRHHRCTTNVAARPSSPYRVPAVATGAHGGASIERRAVRCTKWPRRCGRALLRTGGASRIPGAQVLRRRSVLARTAVEAGR